jgi:hypothetical protein
MGSVGQFWVLGPKFLVLEEGWEEMKNFDCKI